MGLFATLGAISCGKSPLLAPTGTVINLTVTSDAAALNSSVDIIAVLIENGQQSGGTGTGTAATSSSTTGAGTPVQNGTVVSFTTSLGTIEPAEAKTENGKVSVKLKTNGESGTATITAYSGGAKSTAQIKVGATNAKTISVTATPQNLPATGGTSTVTAKVDDSSGNGIVGIPVLFSTTKGTLSSASVLTGAGGTASTTLTTTAAADVTATAGSLAGVKVSVGVSTRASLSLTGPTGSVSVGSPASFAVTVGAGTTLSNTTLNYGDGDAITLGTLSGNQSAIHFYRSAGIKTVTVSGKDPDSVDVSASAQVAITSLSATLAATGTQTPVPATLLFTVTPSPNTASVLSYDWSFNDPHSSTANPDTKTTFGPSFTHIFTVADTYIVTVTLNLQGGGSVDATLVVKIG